MLFQLRKKLGGISAILWSTRFLFGTHRVANERHSSTQVHVIYGYSV